MSKNQKQENPTYVYDKYYKNFYNTNEQIICDLHMGYGGKYSLNLLDKATHDLFPYAFDLNKNNDELSLFDNSGLRLDLLKLSRFTYDFVSRSILYHKKHNICHKINIDLAELNLEGYLKVIITMINNNNEIYACWHFHVSTNKKPIFNRTSFYTFVSSNQFNKKVFFAPELINTTPKIY